MNHQVTTLREFQDLLDAFGADFGRWPESELGAALKFIEHSEEAKSLLIKMEVFEQFLTSHSRSDPPADLLQKIIQKASQSD